jgi:hypothetical protein
MLLALAGGLVAGCGMSSLTSGIGGGWFGGQNKTATDVGSINEDQLLAAAKTDGPARAQALMWRTAAHASKSGRARDT